MDTAFATDAPDPSPIMGVETVTAPSTESSVLICAADFLPDAPPRKWVVYKWIPEGCVTGIFGAGGTGKSLLAQQLATILAANFREIIMGESNDTITE